MTQTRLIREGYYRCPKCKAYFEITDPKPMAGDGYCDSCKNKEGEFALLRYVGPEDPTKGK